MARLRHIAMQVPDPQKSAEFYMRVFGMHKVGETDWENARGVYLSDGVINLALLDYKTVEAAGAERGVDFVGIHHIGFWVDDVAFLNSNFLCLSVNFPCVLSSFHVLSLEFVPNAT